MTFGYDDGLIRQAFSGNGRQDNEPIIVASSGPIGASALAASSAMAILATHLTTDLPIAT